MKYMIRLCFAWLIACVCLATLSAQPVSTLNYDSLWKASKEQAVEFYMHLNESPDSVKTAIMNNFMVRYQDDRRLELNKMLDALPLDAESLNLSNANYNTIPEKVWQLKKLRSLKLSGNKLTAVPAAIGQLKELETIEIHDNALSALPKELEELPKLQVLSIGGNPLTSEKLPKLPSVEVLEANNLLFIPKGLRHWKELRMLKLERSVLSEKSLSPLRKLDSLKHLVLKNSKLDLGEKTFKQGFFSKLFKAKHFPNLQILDLQECGLSELPESIAALPALTNLLALKNNIASLPASLGSMKQMEVLVFYKNALTEIPDTIFALKNLTHLDLYYNELTVVPEGITQLQKLEILYLAHNKIGKLPEGLGEMNSLQEIYLHHNLFYSLPTSMGLLEQVRYLHLHDNQFAQLPTWIANYQKLEELTLGNNPISSLPSWLPKLPKLDYLTLYGLLLEDKEELTEMAGQLEQKGVRVVVEAVSVKD